jgi:Protein of unknown function (DUF4238)
MAEPISHIHHYVPQWHQRRFLPDGQSKLYYLDLKPETILSGGVKHTRKALRCLGPARCFCVEDLYSMRFGKATSDAMERFLFGNVDRDGAAAVDFFRVYDDYKDGIHEAFRALVAYMGAQRFRTPRGLDWIRRAGGVPDHTRTLMVMSELFQLYSAMWMEGVWEIVHARNSTVKFIISDEPVTFFNRLVFPGEAPYPGGDDFPNVGTRTIFPLSMDSCLIITHLQLVRNPHHKPLAIRENARMFGKTMFDLTDIQFGRELEENEILRINHILKLCATRFIAAADKEALYPERHLAGPNWAKLDDDWFLLPNPWKVAFTTGLMMGFKDGRTLAVDEYGRDPRHSRYEERKRQNTEFQTFEQCKREWAERRVGKSLARVINQMKENSVSDKMMYTYLREQGLAPTDEPAPLE